MSKDIDILYGLYSKLQKTTALKVLACQKQRPCTQCTEFRFRLYADFFKFKIHIVLFSDLQKINRPNLI